MYRTLPASRGRFFVAAFIVALFPLQVLAQSEIKIIGQVIDVTTGSGIPGAAIWLREMNKYEIADERGEFHFINIPSGTYTISALRLGYKEPNPVLAVVSDNPAEFLHIGLSPVEIEVAGQVVVESRNRDVAIKREAGTTIIEIKPGTIRSIGEIIREIPEIEAIETSSGTQVRLRGSQTNAVIIMLDGRIQNKALTSTADISSLPLQSISKIEINRGGNYAGGGLAGSINFITESPVSMSGVAVSAAKGSYGFERYAVGARAFPQNNYSASLDFAKSYFRGNFQFDDPRDSTQSRQNNYSRDLNMLGSLGYAKAGSKFSVKGRYYERYAGIPGPVFQTTPLAKSNLREHELYAIYNTELRESIAFDFIGGLTWRKCSFDSPRTATNFIAYKTNFVENISDLKAQFHTVGNIAMNATINLRHETLDGDDMIRPSSSLGEHSRTTNAVAIGGTTRFDEFWEVLKTSAVNLGLRKEGGSGGDFWGMSSTLRFVFNWVASPGFEMALFNSRRLPDMTDLFWKEDVFATPNPELKSERSRGYEAALDFHFNNFSQLEVRIGRFVTEYKDIIIWRKWGGDKFKPENLSMAEVSGWEYSASSHPFDSPIRLNWSASFLRPLNMENDPLYKGKFLTFRPLQTQNAGIEFSYRKFKLKISGKHVGKRYQTEENTKSLPAVNLFDIGIRYDADLKIISLRGSFDIMNLTDEQYEILERQPQKPREYRLGIEISRGRKI